MMFRLRARALALTLLVALPAFAASTLAQAAPAQSTSAQAAPAQATPAQAAAALSEAALTSADVAKLVPDSVFFRGQTASTQKRNAGGVRFADGFTMLASLVDNSGYSTGIQEKYQAYLITEVPLSFGGHTLLPGCYGAGILKIADSLQFVVQDVGAHDLFETAAMNDAKLHRPTPLQVVSSGAAGKYRLYLGRYYVEFERAR